MRKIFSKFVASLAEYRPILLNFRFMRLLMAGMISELGGVVTYFTLLRKVYTLSGGRVTDLGFLTIAQILPRVIVGPIAGVVVDKISRKKIMIISDILNGLIVINLIWIQDLRFIYLTSFFASLVNTFRNPAQDALEPNLVPQEQIILLNSFKASTMSLFRIIRTALGGMTVGFLSVTSAFTFDAITFFVSAAIISTLVIAEQHVHVKSEGAEKLTTRQMLKENVQDLKNGAQIIWGKVSVRMVFLINMFISLLMDMQGVLIYYFLKQTLQLGDQAEKVWGLLLSALGVGGIIGGLIIGSMVKNHRNRFQLFLDILFFDGVFFAAFLVNRYLPLSYVLFAGLGAIGSASGIILRTIIQEEVDDKNRGKVFGLMWTVLGPVSIFSISLGTAGAAAITAVNVLLVSAASELLIAVGLRFTKTYRAAKMVQVVPSEASIEE